MTDLAPPEMHIEVSRDFHATFEHLLCHNDVVMALDPSVTGAVLPPHLHSTASPSPRLCRGRRCWPWGRCIRSDAR